MQGYDINSQIDELMRGRIGPDARGIKWRCDKLARQAMYPNGDLSSIDREIENIKENFKQLKKLMGEPYDSIFDCDRRK